MPPFRNPVDSSEEEQQQWTPPSYAVAVQDSNDSSDWTPPSYAKPVAPKKLSLFEKASKVVKGAAKTAGDITKTVGQDVDEAVSAVSPKVKEFVSGVEALPKSISHSINEIGRTGASQIRQGDIHGAFKTAFSPLMAPIDHVNEMLERKASGKDIGLPSQSEGKHETISQVLGVAGLPADEAIDAYKKGNYSKLAGMGLTAAAIIGLAHYIRTDFPGPPRAEFKGGEPSVRQPRKTPPITDTTPQQDAVAVALTRDNIPRTPANISAETGVPKASVRRTISELKKKTGEVSAKTPAKTTKVSSEADDLTTFMKDNPDAKMSDIEKFLNKTPEETPKVEPVKKPFTSPFEKPKIEEAPIEAAPRDEFVAGIEEARTSQGEEPPLPIRSPNLDPNRFQIGTEAPKSDVKNKEDILHEIATRKFNMGRPLPEEAPKKPITIENAPPDQRARMFRGAHKPVDILFNDSNSREMFGAGQTIFKKGEIKPGILDRLKFATQRAVDRYGLSEREARGAIVDYNAEVRRLGSAVDKEGGNMTAPSFEDFIRSKSQSKGDLFTQATQPQGPVKAGEAYTDEQGRVIGHTTDKEGSTGFEPVKEPSLSERATGKLQQLEDAAKARIDKRGTFKGTRLGAGLPVDDLADMAIIGSTKIARGLVKFADWSTEMLRDFGDSVRPHLKDIWKAAQNKHEEFVGGAVRKLFNSMLEAKGASVEQQAINKVERAKRFAKSAAVHEEGVIGAAKSLAAMRGEFEKVNPGEMMDLSEDESNMLFTAIKRANIDEAEKVRARAALFALFNGDRVPQPNELRVLDQVFGKKFLSKVGGPGASGGYDIGDDTAAKKALSEYIAKNPNAPKEDVKKFINEYKKKAASENSSSADDRPDSFEAAGEKLRKPNDFLTKLANFSSKTTRMLLGFHIPGTALSFHGFNEAIRNTIFGPNVNPFKAAGRFADTAHYLVRPGKAQEFLDINATELGKAIDEGGLKITTGDIGNNSLFKGNNIITKGINYLSNPKPLFGQVIPALKLKGYRGLLAQYEKAGMPHAAAAKAAGEATNNIFGGLNLTELERSPNTQKLFRAAALAPDWLESNVRLGKGMFNAIRNPSSPQSKVYLSGMTNFLGSYIALNVINAINNDGKFSFQNDVGHELDIAIGKDAMGRVRYFSPYGTAMDMFRIPVEIGHAAVEGNMGKAFSDMRSRASEPGQFLTDLMTNTDYAGRTLYDKTKYGKQIPKLEQGENILGAAAGHFLPIGAESAVNFSQGKISPEQFASQVLQVPMKYKFPDQPNSSLKIRKLKLQ